MKFEKEDIELAKALPSKDVVVTGGKMVKVKSFLTIDEVQNVAFLYFDTYFNGFEVTTKDKDGTEISERYKDGIGSSGFNPIWADYIARREIARLCADIENFNEVFTDIYDLGIIHEIMDHVENAYSAFDFAEGLIRRELSVENTLRVLSEKLIKLIPDDANMAHILEIAPEMINKIDPKRWKVIADSLIKPKK